MGILMDESGSVGKDEFTKEKNFVKALAGNFQIGPNAAQFGVITYSTVIKAYCGANMLEQAFKLFEAGDEAIVT